MNMKFQCCGAVLLAGLAAGCATDQEPIVFYSEARIPATAAQPADAARGLSKLDEQKIDVAVFSHLLTQHFWDNGDYSALFLQADDEVVTAMIQKFPDHNPPLKQSSHLDLRSAQSPLDRDTGLPVMILGVDMGDPNADGSVEAVGRWYAGTAVKGSYSFTLKKAGDDWTIAGGQ